MVQVCDPITWEIDRRIKSSKLSSTTYFVCFHPAWAYVRPCLRNKKWNKTTKTFTCLNWSVGYFENWELEKESSVLSFVMNFFYPNCSSESSNREEESSNRNQLKMTTEESSEFALLPCLQWMIKPRHWALTMDNTAWRQPQLLCASEPLTK